MGDRTVVDHMDQLKKEIDELVQENGQLRSECRDLTQTLKDFQEIEFKRKQQDKLRLDRESVQQQAIDDKLRELETERVKTQEERDRAEGLRAAFNADKQAMMDRLQDMEKLLREKDSQVKEMTRRVSLMEQNDHLVR